MKKTTLAALLLGAALLPALQACVPVVAAGVTTGVMAAFDRSSIGTQTEDESIEWKASTRISEKLGDKAHVNFTSFNRKVLMTGEVPNADAKAESERIVREIANVQDVMNELAIGPAASFSDRSNDSYITSRIKSRSLDFGKFNPVHVKVVTEAKVALETEAHDHDHDAEGHAEEGHDDHAEGARHAEFDADYLLTCGDPTALDRIAFAYFAAFPNARELDVQLVSDKGAGTAKVTRDADILDLAGRI